MESRTVELRIVTVAWGASKMAGDRIAPEQKTAVESLLGRRVLEDEAISVRAIESAPFPISGKRNWSMS